MHYTINGGQRIHYEKVGNTGEGILILHGLGGDLESMIPLSRSIKNECTRILVDAPCHGGSDDFEISIRDMGKELISLMVSNGFAKFFALGVSLGSIIIEEMMLDYPENLLGSVLLSPASKIDSAVIDRVSSWVSSEDRVSTDVFSEGFLEKHRKEIEEYDKAHPMRPERLYHIIPTLLDFTVKGRQSNTRSVMVVAEYDTIFGKRMNDDLQTAFPNSRFVTLNSGHAIHREDPRGAARIASEFIFG